MACIFLSICLGLSILNGDPKVGLENLGRICILISLVCCGSPLIGLVSAKLCMQWMKLRKWMMIYFRRFDFCCRNTWWKQRARTHFRSHWFCPCSSSVLSGGCMESWRLMSTCKLQTFWEHWLPSFSCPCLPFILQTRQCHQLHQFRWSISMICSKLKKTSSKVFLESAKMNETRRAIHHDSTKFQIST